MTTTDSTHRFAATVAAFLLPLFALGPAAAVETALVAGINGTPTVERAGKTEALRRGDVVATGDIVSTDAAAKIKLLLADDSVLAIGPNSRVVVDQFLLQPASRTVRLRVLAGRFKLAVAKFFGGTSDYEVQTPTAVAGVRGTVLWGDTDLDAICALDGSIEVRTTKGTEAQARVAAGHCVQKMKFGKVTPLTPSAADLAKYLREVTLE